MAKKEDPNGTMNLGELSTIRNILMGQQMNEYDSRFAEVEKLIVDSEEKSNQKLNALAEKTAQQMDALKAEMSERFDKLESLLMDNVSKLNQKMEATSRDDKHELGKFLSEVGKKLMDA